MWELGPVTGVPALERVMTWRAMAVMRMPMGRAMTLGPFSTATTASDDSGGDDGEGVGYLS
jgi:hypothetical protein